MEISISGDILVWIEVYAGLLFLATVSVWIVFNRFPAAYVVLLIALAVLGTAAFRPPEYNSDTMNYLSYVNTLSFLDLWDALFTTKLEPLHSFLIVTIKDFRVWLIVESVIEIVGMCLAYKFRKNDYSFIVLCGFALTLSTSSLRYAISLVYFMYFVYTCRERILDAARMTAILSCLHASMLLSGILFLRRTIYPVLLSLVCAAILYERSLLGSRLELDLSDPSRGFKVLAIVLAIMAYFLIRSPRSISPYHVAYFVAVFLMFAVSALILPTFNRFVIMAGLVLLANEWSTFRGKGEGDALDRAFILVVSALILVPYIYILPTIYFSGTW